MSEVKRRYRICATCGRKWNVSAIARQYPTYICPECELKEFLDAIENDNCK